MINQELLQYCRNSKLSRDFLFLLMSESAINGFLFQFHFLNLLTSSSRILEFLEWILLFSLFFEFNLEPLNLSLFVEVLTWWPACPTLSVLFLWDTLMEIQSRRKSHPFTTCGVSQNTKSQVKQVLLKSTNRLIMQKLVGATFLT